MNIPFQKKNFQKFTERRDSLKKLHNTETTIRKIEQKYEISEERSDRIRAYMNEHPFTPPKTIDGQQRQNQ